VRSEKNMDNTDKKILRMLSKNARETNSNIAKELGLAPSATFQRIKKLERKEIIIGSSIELDKEALGFHLTCFVFVRTSVNYPKSVEEGLRLHPNVLEVHEVAGPYSFLCKVIAQSPKHMLSILKNDFSKMKEIIETDSKVVFNTTSDHNILPI
jgi:Lrp/AsnC family transcriptional regulator, leucine-responsive regulatory protein